MTDAQIRMLIIFIGAVAIAIVFVLLYRALKSKRQNADLNMQRELAEEELDLLKEYEQSILDLFAEIEEGRCDTQTALAISEQCKEYIGGSNLTGQPIADALFAYKRKECDDKGVSLEIESAAFPKEGLEGEEYVGILGNLIDNAIEAAVKTENPWVHVKSMQKAGQWILVVTNSKLAQLTPLESEMKTTKLDADNHGLGTKIVKKIAKKHKGVVKYKDNGDSFEAMIAIPVNWE